MKVLLTLILVMILSACATIQTPYDDDYEFGQTTDSIIQLQDKYCSETSPVRRMAYLSVIRSVIPEYPLTGACTPLLDLVIDEEVQDADKEAYKVSRRSGSEGYTGEALIQEF